MPKRPLGADRQRMQVADVHEDGRLHALGIAGREGLSCFLSSGGVGPVIGHQRSTVITLYCFPCLTQCCLLGSLLPSSRQTFPWPGLALAVVALEALK